MLGYEPSFVGDFCRGSNRPRCRRHRVAVVFVALFASISQQMTFKVHDKRTIPGPDLVQTSLCSKIGQQEEHNRSILLGDVHQEAV